MPKNNLNKVTGPAGAAPNPAATSSAMPHFISVDQAAQRLAVSSKTIRRAIKDGRLAAARFGRRVLISQGALQQFMTALILAGAMVPAPQPKP
jgi:excisionase family DNA binding protein